MVNGISPYTTSSASNYVNETAKNDAAASSQTKTSKKTVDDTAAVYESSSSSKHYTSNTKVVKQMMADAEARTSQLKDLVAKLIGKQGDAIINAKDMWQRLRTGDIKVDKETALKAQEAISEDGYYGVKQTSDRIVEFAKAISGGDPDKIELLKDAFKKGFGQATKTWGSKLPDISQKTYDEVMSKFDKWAEESKPSNSNVEDITT